MVLVSMAAFLLRRHAGGAGHMPGGAAKPHRHARGTSLHLRALPPVVAGVLRQPGTFALRERGACVPAAGPDVERETAVLAWRGAVRLGDAHQADRYRGGDTAAIYIVA